MIPNIFNSAYTQVYVRSDLWLRLMRISRIMEEAEGEARDENDSLQDALDRAYEGEA